MALYYGNYEYQLDAKGRMRMPAKFRALMGSEYLVTPGVGGCLYVLDNETKQALETKFAAIPLSDIEGGNAVRKFTSTAISVECDEQGRFLLSTQLRNYAKICKNIVIVGAGNKVEIWSKEQWDEQEGEITPQSFEQTFASLSKFGV